MALVPISCIRILGRSVVLRLVRSLSIPTLAALLLCQSCGLEYSPQARPFEVALGVGGAPATRTSPDSGYTRFTWDEGDRIAVWAKSDDGSYALEARSFKLYASTDSPSPLAWFSATLDAPMAEGAYTYYMCYPLPESLSGTTATFTVPSVQDGDLSGGADIIVSVPAEGGALQPIGDNAVLEQGFSVQMKHLLHFLRFYIPEGCNLLGEPVERIEFSMPQCLAGTVSVDVTDASSAALSAGSSTVTLTLKQSLSESSGEEKRYAPAAIFPPETAYGQSDHMLVKLYSANKYAELYYLLAGRSFLAGHVTSVALRPEAVKPRYSLRFTLASNNLGEEPQKITLTLPDGVCWPGTDSNTYTYAKEDGAPIGVGDSFSLETLEQTEFAALSGCSVTVGYESESALVSRSVTLADLSDATLAGVSLDCPYLFFEDFSAVESFNSNDEYGISSAGSKDAHTFLDGWSAARAGAQAGTAIRIACRRETGLANYSARADSPFLSGLKEGKTVNLSLSFDYSMNRQGTPKISQTVHIGYISTADNLKSGDDKGTFPHSFEINETTGSYDTIDHTCTYTLDSVGAPIRLSWRTVPETNWGANNNTCWLYIDNVKVKISK